jgi:hypothetical protein
MEGSGFDLAGGGVPGDSGAAEIGFVGHVAGECSIVTEDGVFSDGLAGFDGAEKGPEMRL